MKRFILAFGRILGATGRATIVLVGICGVGAALANYAVTLGSGTNFGSAVVLSVHYAQQLICDYTAPATNCAKVQAGNAAGTTDVALTVADPNLLLIAQAPLPVIAGTTPTTQAAVSTGVTTKAQSDLNGNLYISPSQAGGAPLGQALAAASAPVVLPAAQITALTPPSNTGYALSANQTVDPCSLAAKTNVPISTASGTLALVTGVSAKKIYVCSLSLITSGTISVSLAEGSSNTCGTSNQAGVIGVATNGTAANGLPLVANGGLTLGNGAGTVAVTATAANYLCLFQSGTTQMAGNLTYVQQ